MKTNRNRTVGGKRQGKQFSLRNNFGFWELTFNGRCAVVPQHQALFYVAWLLANPSPVPISAPDLATRVFSQFGTHHDFDISLPWGCLQRDDDEVSAILRSKQQALEAILDRQDLIDVAKTEAQRELAVVQQFQSAVQSEIAQTAEEFGHSLMAGMRHLHFKLSSAYDLRGNPHPVLRAFGAHLLRHLLIPSGLASDYPQTSFTYQPPSGLAWSE